jgi:Domain of unknown function (DUF4397)
LRLEEALENTVLNSVVTAFSEPSSAWTLYKLLEKCALISHLSPEESNVFPTHVPQGGNMKTLVPILVISSLALSACQKTPAPPPAPAQVRFVHASTDAGAVDLYLDKTTKLTSSALSVKTTLPATGYTPQTAGTPKLDVCAAGSVLCPVKDASITLASDKNQTVFIHGSAAGSGATALGATVLLDDKTAPSAATNFRLRIVNADSALSQVDVYITGPTDPLNSVLPAVVDYKTASTYLEKTAGSYRIRVTAHSSTTPVVDTGAQGFTGTKIYTFVIVGPTADSALLTDN